MQSKWDALTLSPEHGGLGIALSPEQARKAFFKYPRMLTFSTETLADSWALLTATERGLGLSRGEALRRILVDPRVLGLNFSKLTRRMKLLESLGYKDGRRMVLTHTASVHSNEETVKASAAWWQECSGLDHAKVITARPTLLGAVSAVQELQNKLDFLRDVVGMSNAQLNNAGSLFSLSLDGRLRRRYFYARQMDKLGGKYSFSTLALESDASFLAMLQGRPRPRTTGIASAAEVADYKKHVTSAEFVAYCKEEEARLRADRAATR